MAEMIPLTIQEPTPWRAPPRRSILFSAVLVALSAGIAFVLRSLTPTGSVALIFLVSVLFSAVLFGFWPGIAAACMAFVAYNFFFVDPILTLRVTHAEDFLALGVFVLVAGLTGTLAGRLREQATAAQNRARLLERLSSLSNVLGAAKSEDEVLRALQNGLEHLTGAPAPIVDRSLSAIPALDLEDMQTADRALRHGSRQLAAASGWSAGRYSFYPLARDSTSPLVAGVNTARLSPEHEAAIAAAIEQAGAAITRLRLARVADEARLQAERESLRSALLSSLSHDLKTPLATILGSVTTLRQLGSALSDTARTDLLEAIEEDARRLNSYVADLLHMTRLQTGLDPRLDWVDPRDILNGAVARIRREHPQCRLDVRIGQDLPLLNTDFALLEQALFNCLDNAAKIAPADTVIVASLHPEHEALHFSVEDAGPGVPAEEHLRIFEPFQRGSTASPAGTGLGLAISRGIVQALGGTVTLDSPLTDSGGARFRLSLPASKEASQ